MEPITICYTLELSLVRIFTLYKLSNHTIKYNTSKLMFHIFLY